MQVKRATVSDVPAIAPLFAGYRDFYGAGYDVEAATAYLTERLERDESVVLLAFDADNAVGFTQIYPTFSSTRLARVWTLNDLFVSEVARGTGAVDALLDAAAALAKEAGAIEINLSTAHTNERAQAVYVRHGYQLDETYRSYDKHLT